MTTSAAAPITCLLPLVDVGEVPTFVTVKTSPNERVALAKFLDIVAVEHCEAKLEVRGRRDGGAVVHGEVRADVVQSCIVTLAPVAQSLVEAVHVIFVPPTVAKRMADEIDYDETGQEPPDVIEGNALDLGALVAEHVALGLDPYPRTPGAEFGELEIGEPEAEPAPPSPFAELGRLKDRDPGERT